MWRLASLYLRLPKGYDDFTQKRIKLEKWYNTDTMDLFDHAREKQIEEEAPLAARMRPRTLDEFIGQEHIVGPGRLLRRAIQADQLSSLIFYGPPGTGKTTLARIIANSTHAHLLPLMLC